MSDLGPSPAVPSLPAGLADRLRMELSALTADESPSAATVAAAVRATYAKVEAEVLDTPGTDPGPSSVGTRSWLVMAGW